MDKKLPVEGQFFFKKPKKGTMRVALLLPVFSKQVLINLSKNH
jgi:hypothetical protein